MTKEEFKELKQQQLESGKTPDFITFLRYYIAHIENQAVTSFCWVMQGDQEAMILQM